jgi:diguanylate cyclase (GGDEF)-like protein
MRVVLADPSRTVHKVVTRLLRARGHEVFAFADGASALAFLRDGAADVLITSTEPNGMSGFELCWEARLIAAGRRPMYIVMMSSRREQQVVCEALDSGADDFIGKPPATEELYARMRAAERLVRLERDLMELASTDPLTGALNRRAYFTLAHDAVEAARRGAALAVVMVDIDRFKMINDIHGHDSGDVALRAVVQVADQERAVFARLGGEEFAFLLPGWSAADALVLAERVRARVAATEVPVAGAVLSMTCSFGVAEWEAGEGIDSLLKRADIALYQAKTGGRNRVVVAEDPAAWVSMPRDPGSVIRAEDRDSLPAARAAGLMRCHQER